MAQNRTGTLVCIQKHLKVEGIFWKQEAINVNVTAAIKSSVLYNRKAAIHDCTIH